MRGWNVTLGVALAIAGCKSHGADDRARDVIVAARGGSPDTGMLALDGVITGADWDKLDERTKADVGAELVRLLATKVSTPFTPEQLDQATRVVTRYQGLPGRARAGAAQAAMVAALASWEAAMSAPAQREIKISLL